MEFPPWVVGLLAAGAVSMVGVIGLLGGLKSPAMGLSLESIWGKRKGEAIIVPSRQKIGTTKYSKNLFLVGKLKDLRKLGESGLHIKDPITGKMARRINFIDEGIVTEFIHDKITHTFSGDTDVYYEPWFMDRGSYMVFVPEEDSETGEDIWIKYATEFDHVDAIGETPVPLFELGMIVGTPGAMDALREAMQDPGEFLGRHVTGDWGDLPEEDINMNEMGIEQGDRIFSVYHTTKGVKLYVITEWDRSVTTILLPMEY